MISLTTSSKAQKMVAKNMQSLRLEKGLTQKGLSERSGVSLSTLRKFEQIGSISLESFFKLNYFRLLRTSCTSYRIKYESVFIN